MSPPRGWLARVVDETFARSSVAPRGAGGATASAMRRRAVAALHHRGLACGAPLLGEEQLLSKEAAEVASLVRWVVVLCDVVDACGVARDDPALPRPEQVARRVRALTVALALVYASDEDAALLASGAGPARIDRSLGNVERELLRRRYLQGNPLVGLVLNHAFTAIDARAVLEAVVAVYVGDPTPGAALRIQTALQAERLATLAAIARLSELREGGDSELVRSAAEWQVKSLGLARAETARLLEQVKRPADLSRLVTMVPPEARQRVFLHTVLVACVDGRVSPEEGELLASFARALGLPPPVAARVERRARAFVEMHRAWMNPLAYAEGFAAANPPMSVRVARGLFENLDHLWNEIRETGDLAVLLARRARGQTLTDDEQRRMREQLLDVARAVPGLAFVSLPGGFVLLALLLKILPFDLRPSSFRGADFRAFARGQGDALAREGRQRADEDASSS